MTIQSLESRAIEPPMTASQDETQAALAELQAQGLRRGLRALPATGGKFLWGGREYLNFSSNDYLNLAGDLRLRRAASLAVEHFGCGATASRLMSGHLELHERLETALARLLGRPAALVFGSGFLTNIGVLGALAGRGDQIFTDKLNHASLVDGARLSGAKVHRYHHGDAGHLAQLLEHSSTGDGKTGRSIVVTDSIFSMDGDAAPLRAVAEVARRAGAMLIVDEAHAIGILGPCGGGLCRTLPAELQPDLVTATMSKALGGYGGFAGCSAALRELLINRARSFIYSTGLPPACLGSAIAACEILEAEPALGERLLERTRMLASLLGERGFALDKVQSPILPIMVGDNKKALALAARLLEDHILAVAVRPPTVPAGTARLRLSVTLAHTPADLLHAAERIALAARELGIGG